MLADTSRDLHDKFGIEHATIQIEKGDGSFGCQREQVGAI
jgi:hypothetical protein